MTSIYDAIEMLTTRHMQYIEANYHLRHSRLIGERRRLMEAGEVASQAWVEATPRYVSGENFINLGLPKQVLNILLGFNQENLGVFDPPYQHQAEGLRKYFLDDKDLIVSTGTGSGKTEIFLYCILGSLALEASRGKTNSQRGFRAIILYPMNALVADQLSRLRRLLGSDEGAVLLENLFKRRIQFGMYTSRTPYHGVYDERRNDVLLRPLIDYYYDLQTSNQELFNELRHRGRIPTKDLVGFRNRGHAKNSQYRTQPTDTELFTRQEMHSPNEYGGAPDILITNYSMLEYMLLRPIEQPLFQSTREWLASDEQNQLIVVIDEAHLYRGAQGAEVALLIRRLLQYLNIPRSRARFILTSASLGSDDTARRVGPEFAADLTGSTADQFEVILGTKRLLENGTPGSNTLANILADINFEFDNSRVLTISNYMQWPSPPRNDENALKLYLGTQLIDHPTFKYIHDILRDEIQPLSKLAKKIFPDINEETSIKATLNLLFLSSQAWTDNNQVLFPVRIHMFFKGLPKQYICLNPRCKYRRTIDSDNELLGRMFTEPRFLCECGSRVFELLSHRTCGAAYIKAFRRRSDRNLDPMFLWTNDEGTEEMEEIHILLESPRTDPDLEHPHQIPLSQQTQRRYLDMQTGHLIRALPEEDENRFINVWIPSEGEAPSERGAPWSWTRCPACGIRERRRPRGQTYIMDLETKGEEIFANVVRTLFQFQPEARNREHLPNRGRKALCFSDGRQKAARLARDLQRTVELDTFREVIVDTINDLPANSTMLNLFPAIIINTSRSQIAFFDDGDAFILADGSGYPGSRTRFVEIQRGLDDLVQRYGLQTIDNLIHDRDTVNLLNRNRPRQYNAAILRLLGDRFYSIRASLVAYLIPTGPVFRQIEENNNDIDSNLLWEIVAEVIRYAAEQRAFDPTITDRERCLSRATSFNPLGYERSRGECFTFNEIIPPKVRNRVGNLISDVQWENICRSLIRSGAAEQLFSSTDNLRYAINPNAVTLRIALEEPWYRCIGCWQFFSTPLAGRCPECGGILEEVGVEDPHMSARKSLFRDPCIEVIYNRYSPFTLRSEEHSAQLSHKDYAEVFTKTEQYELLFQDILISGNEIEQPIDVLSCTTTMEVGIDIGSLTGVALRTVPPRPENYQQRAGRAGRRGTALSSIATFADNSPHETYHFFNPNLMIGAPVSEPTIYIGNRKISERHINASLLQHFFHRNIEGDYATPQLPQNADVFSSLGLSRDFFNGDGNYSFNEFNNWINEHIIPSQSPITQNLANLLSETLREFINTDEENWREQFVIETANELIINLRNLANRINWDVELDDENLLSTLLDAALLPTFSFPIDICSFTVKEVDRNRNAVVTKYEMTQELRQALTEYIPGRQVVVDKKTYIPRGIYFPFTNDPINRAVGEDWGNLDWLNFCNRCGTILEERRRDLSNQGVTCQICSDEIQSHNIFRPPGFSPEVDPSYGVIEREQREEERIYATSAKYPLPVRPLEELDSDNLIRLSRGSVRMMPNQELLVVNFGPNDGGFEICTLCGAIGGSDGLRTPHNRPYPRDPRVRNRQWPRQCSGPPISTTLGYNFHTDLVVLRIEVRLPLNFAWGETWFRSAVLSLTEALVLGASRTIGIDSNELAGGGRLLPPFPDDDPSIFGYIEIFLYDTTPGGAGFASRTYDRFQGVLESTMQILTSCNCSQSCHACLRTYDNRRYHTIIDRKLGSSLLTYVRSGILPQLDDDQNRILANQLQLTLNLMEPNIQFDNANGTFQLWQVTLGTNTVSLRFRSCLAEPDITDSDADIIIPDYDILHNLPRIAHEILGRLR